MSKLRMIWAILKPEWLLRMRVRAKHRIHVERGLQCACEASNGLGGSNLADVEYEEINRPILLMCRAGRHVSH